LYLAKRAAKKEEVSDEQDHKLAPWLTGTAGACVLYKRISWPGWLFGFVSFLATYPVITVLLESIMQSYGIKS
jgi:hypothetical protein